MSSARADRVLGVILAGGDNRRYGGRHKALDTIGGRRILDRLISSLSPVCGETVIVANVLAAYEGAGHEVRPDLVPGLGALGGLHTAVFWAAESGCDAALVVACDMPFVPESLLRLLAERAGRAGVIVPESNSRRGFEPLCAAYGVDCEPAIAAALEAGDRAVVSFFDAVPVEVLDSELIAEHGDPGVMFLNVNRPQDVDSAERVIATERSRQ
ncbi:MAG: molybdenum cofactor guanylyltransferase [Gemmatimonadota bacterium]